MFGSKLRSWMESHIGRPRKKGNKNKNANCVAAASAATGCGGSYEAHSKKTTAATGYTIYHRNGTTTTTTIAAVSVSASASAAASSSAATAMTSITSASSVGAANHHGYSSSGVISSPVRRREVSPIQNHTQSRYGWQSPDQETGVTSPKSDNFLYAPQHHHRVRSLHHTAPNSKDNSIEEKPAPRHLLQQQLHATHPHQQHQQHQHQQQQQQQQQQPDCSSSSISSLSWSTGSKEPSMPSAKRLPQIEVHCSSASASAPASSPWDDDPNVVHYEEIRTILRHPENATNSHFVEQERPKSEQLSSFAPLRSLHERTTQDDASTRYGRLLPSKIQHIQGSGSSIDSLSANRLRVGGGVGGGSADCIIPSSHDSHRLAASHNGGMPPPYVAATAGYHCPGAQSASFAAVGATHTQRNRLRTTGRYGGGSPAMPGGGGGPAVPLHSLSSPESAYSTGYSTDGTSPGAIYTPPEYYINMRTGTHYFPKSVNSLAIEAQRYKFGLNKIEEMSPIDPLPKMSFASMAGRQRSELFDDGAKLQLGQAEQLRPLPHPLTVGCHSPLALRNTIILPTLKGFESSSSPRQRCRIRTNPWYSTTDTSSSGTGGTGGAQPFAVAATTAAAQMSTSSTFSSSKSSAESSVSMKMELDAASITSSSGIKSSNDAEAEGPTSEKNKHANGKTPYESSESSSSLTEVENMQRTYSPHTVRRRRAELLQQQQQQQQFNNSHHHSTTTEPVAAGGVMADAHGAPPGRPLAPPGVDCQDATLLSDDDATLNEMMGKFDESYVYEKETDILSSDSDPTDCPSDLDTTGQDAGDECDTDELLDIDFIDTSSMQEVCAERRDSTGNMGSSCPCYDSGGSPKRAGVGTTRASLRSRRSSRSLKGTTTVSVQEAKVAAAGGGSQRRRKRFLKTRKKSAENNKDHNRAGSPVRKSRESRSVGGTPVCMRRNQSVGRERVYKTSPLSNRSSSLVFTHVRERRFLAIAESEKALLRADMEADVKYRQLILEAESLLVSMRNSTQSIARETPVASPRRVNPLANKRVEMLKNGEADAKRDLLKQQQQHQRSLDAALLGEQEAAAALNRRIELLKHDESASAPNSPKSSRCSPRKTHLTNFISQNTPPDVPPQRKSATASLPDALQRPQSPQLQLNGRRLLSPSGSPQNRRRISRSQSPKAGAPANAFESDSDGEQRGAGGPRRTNSIPLPQNSSSACIAWQVLLHSSAEDVVNHNYLPEVARIMVYDESDYTNRNTGGGGGGGDGGGGGVSGRGGQYCPQSEPLKRKVYKGSSTLERIQKSIDLESELPKQAMLAKINQLRRNDSASAAASKRRNDGGLAHDDDGGGSSGGGKQQLILSTIADLKRSLESQSVELNGLNED